VLRSAIPIFFVAILILEFSQSAAAQQPLAVTVQVDSAQKRPGDSVVINGRVTAGGVAASGALVGVTVNGPDGNPIVVRSVTTSPNGSYRLEPFLLSNSAAGGTYVVTASANFQGQTASGSTSFTIPAGSAPRRCLVATAAFGSELSPPVRLLRELRDAELMSSNIGSQFISVFNEWYYSFSPPLSAAIGQDYLLQVSSRALLYPLIGILAVVRASFEALAPFLGRDGAAVLAGALASSLVGVAFLSLPVALSKRISNSMRPNGRTAKPLGILGIVFALVLSLNIFPGFSAAALLLTFAALSVYLVNA